MRRLVAAVVFVLVAASGIAQKSKGLAEGTGKVGVTQRVFHPADRRNWRGAEHKELRCTVWYPAVVTAVETPQVVGPPGDPLFEAGSAAVDAPMAPASKYGFGVVLLSHGSGGSAVQLAWLGTALARAGYVAVAVNHPGNNALEAMTVEGSVLWWERATDLSNVLDGMLADGEFGQSLDKARVGVAGFSLGGYTVLELAGAETDVDVIYDLCNAANGDGANPKNNAGMDPKFVDANAAVCSTPEMRGMGKPIDMLRLTRKTSGESLARSNESFQDARVGAVFAIAPAMGFTLTDESLRGIKIPAEVVVGQEDKVAPALDNATYVRSQIHGARETVLPGVRHYTFLDTCTALGKKDLAVYCEDSAKVNRDAVHAQVAAEAVKFFDRSLR